MKLFKKTDGEHLTAYEATGEKSVSIQGGELRLEQLENMCVGLRPFSCLLVTPELHYPSRSVELHPVGRCAESRLHLSMVKASPLHHTHSKRRR